MARRRSESSFLSDAEKLARREMLNELVTAALERLETGEGWREWLISRHLHGDSLTPANNALAAFQSPGQVVGGYRFWGGVKKGKTADAVLIGRTFWPVAHWSSGRFGDDVRAVLVKLGTVAPDRDYCEELARSWSDLPNTVDALRSYVETMAARLDEAAGPVLESAPVDDAEPAYDYSGGDIPF